MECQAMCPKASYSHGLKTKPIMDAGWSELCCFGGLREGRGLANGVNVSGCAGWDAWFGSGCDVVGSGKWEVATMMDWILMVDSGSVT